MMQPMTRFLQIWSDSLGYPGSIIYSSDNFDFPQL